MTDHSENISQLREQTGTILAQPARGHAMPPGSGPDGETCGSCIHLRQMRLPRHNRPGASRVYLKCSLMRVRWKRGRKTDVRAKDPACALWRKPDND